MADIRRPHPHPLPGAHAPPLAALVLTALLALALPHPAGAQAQAASAASATDALSTAAGAQAPVTTLAHALRRAVEVHPSVQEAEAAAEMARAELSSSRSEWFPELAVRGNATRFQEPMLVSPLHRFDPSAVPAFDETLLQGTLSLDWTVWDGGRRGARVDRDDALARSAGERERDARSRLLARTSQAYLAVLAAREVVTAQELREEALEAERERAARFVEEGSSPRLHLLRAEAELASVRAEGEATRQRLELAVTTLARILDLPPEDLSPEILGEPSLSGETVPGPTAGIRVPADEAAGASFLPELDRAPAVQAALRQVDAARAGQAAARASWFPTLEVRGGYNLFSGASQPTVTEWQGGLMLSYPLFTGGARSSAGDAAQARTRAARAALDRVREETALAADRARSAETEARARVRALETALEQYDELVRVEALALVEGAGVQTDWLRAQAGLFRTRAALAEARYAVVQARLEWARAVGALDLDWILTRLEVTP